MGNQAWVVRGYNRFVVLLLESVMSSRRQNLRQRSTETLRGLLQTMITLASSSLGLVAALAWNEAIKKTFEEKLGKGDALSALYLYAVLATLMAIAIVGALGWVAATIGGAAVIDREAEG
jgi:hypothetical protein